MLHGEVSREMFQGLWPDFDTSEVPITSITNGVHHLTWVHRDLLDLLEAPTGSTADSVIDGYDWNALAGVDSHTHLGAEAQPADRADHDGPAAGWPRAAPTGACPPTGSPTCFDPDVRDLRLRPAGALVQAADPDAAATRTRLKALLTDPKRPIQIVIAGKSHPADEGGKALIQQMVQFADDPAVRRPDRLPARLRHLHGQAALPRL